LSESILSSFANAGTGVGLADPGTGGSAVRARAPLRLGLAGGGTDLSPYCDEFGGAVLNATIDRYAHAFVTLADEGVHFRAVDLNVTERFAALDQADGARLQLHAAVHRRFVDELRGGKPLAVSVTTSVDSPPGSGLGSSSALVVALVEAYRRLFAVPLGAYEVARLAFVIEREDLAMAGGRQDQYAAAFGGINFIEFLAEGRTVVNPLRVPREIVNELESSLVICFSGQSRVSSSIIEAQQQGMRSAEPAALQALHELKHDAAEMKSALLSGRFADMVDLLNRSRRAKSRTASGIETGLVSQLQDLGLANGALACKVSGAGGGGFIMFLVPPEDSHHLITTLNAAGAQASAVKFTQTGAESWWRSASSL